MKTPTIGVLAFQGAIEEHLAMIKLAFKEMGIEGSVKRFILKTVMVLVGVLLICDYLEVISLKPLRDFVERNLVILAAIFCLLIVTLICRMVSRARKEGDNDGAG